MIFAKFVEQIYENFPVYNYILSAVLLQECRIVDENEVEVSPNEVEVAGELRIKVTWYLCTYWLHMIAHVEVEGWGKRNEQIES